MSRFDCFEFLRNRTKCIPPTQEEQETFDFWSTLVAFSMVPGSMPVTDAINTVGFSRLPKKVQCMTFTQLDGKSMYGQWQKAKASKTKSTKDFIDKLCKLFGCSENEAKSFIDHKIFDEKRINHLYNRVYEPDKVKISKAKKR